MRFDRGLRSAALRPYPQGYVAMPTDGFNREKASCYFGGVKDSGVWLTETAYPPVIGLQVRLVPVWIDNGTACAQVGDSEPCALYPPQSAFCEVRGEATGIGHYQKASGEEKILFTGTRFLDYHLVLPEPFLYRKVFLTQPEGRLIRRSASQTAVDGIPYLWAYGGQQRGDDIHPFVFTMESIRHETFAQASSLLYWRERGIYPSGEEGAFQDVFEEDQSRTLCESIEAGMSCIHLGVGVDEKGRAAQVPYRSFQLSKNVIFYKKEQE